MPYAPKRPCRYPGCPNVCKSGVYCEKHRPLFLRESPAERGYDSKWRRARSLYLKAHPLCASCYREGRLTPATVVDHIRPHRGDHELFWDENNWQPLCKSCHDHKTGSGL